MPTSRDRLARLIPYAVIALWFALAAYLSSANPTVGISDMFEFIDRAEELTVHDRSPWVHGLYPFGYPLLLRLLSAFTGDYEIAGRVISLVSGAVGLTAIFLLSRALFTAPIALLALAVCGITPSYTHHAVISGTDMPAAALLVLGVYFLCRFAMAERRGDLVAGGAALGASYLIRYTALIVVPVVVLWLLVRRQQPTAWRRRAGGALLFVGAFALVASPQLVLSFIDQGNPFYNLQARNVYFGMLGGHNWGKNMPAARSVTSLSEVVRAEPGLFLRNWYVNIVDAMKLPLVPFPLGLVSYAGLLFGLRRSRTRDRILLLTVVLMAYTAAICLAFPSTRLLLFCSVLLAPFAAFGIATFTPRRLRLAFPFPIPVRTPLVVALLAWLLWTYQSPALLHPLPQYDETRMDVSAALSREGLVDASEVLAFSFDYYDLTKPTKDRFAIPWYDDDFQPYESVDDIARRMKDGGQRYLVFDRKAPRHVQGLDKIWPFDEDALRRNFDPMAVFPDSVCVYRLREGTDGDPVR